MRRAAPLALAAAVLAGATALAQQPPAGGPPPAAAYYPFEKAQGPEVTDGNSRLADRQDGQRLYQRICGVCHLEGGMASLVLIQRLPPDQVLLEKRADLDPAFVIQSARSGIGSMPAITRVDATDAELAAIADYLGRKR